MPLRKGVQKDEACLQQKTQRRQETLPEYQIPGTLSPLLERQFKRVRRVPRKQFFHPLGQFFAVDLDIDLIVANRTEAIQVSRADSRPLTIDSAGFRV